METEAGGGVLFLISGLKARSKRILRLTIRSSGALVHFKSSKPAPSQWLPAQTQNSTMS